MHEDHHVDDDQKHADGGEIAFLDVITDRDEHVNLWARVSLIRKVGVMTPDLVQCLCCRPASRGDRRIGATGTFKPEFTASAQPNF
jgi:hypothetical protein